MHTNLKHNKVISTKYITLMNDCSLHHLHGASVKHIRSKPRESLK